MANRSFQFIYAVVDFLSSDKMGHRPCADPAIAKAWRRIRAARWLFRASVAAALLNLVWPVGPGWSFVPPVVAVAVLLVTLAVWARIDLMEDQIARGARDREHAGGPHTTLPGRS